MASTSHYGQIRHSGSPSVIALSSAKAPSAAAAKPRFRSRTGCWTCRRRKVKCDERGRNPGTVAYAGPLSSSSGCKRCEDSGRPCHGYGAQAPSGPLNTQYSSSNLHADPSLSSAPFYSFSSHAHEPAGNSIPYLATTSNLETSPCPIPNPIQWNNPFEQPLVGSQNISYGLRMAHHTQPSSGPTSTSVGGSSLAPLPPSNVHLPSVDLRRFSVPNYPTWQRPTQPRNNSQYTSGGIVENGLFQSSTEYDHVDLEVRPLNNSSCASETPQSGSHPNDSTVLPADPYRPLGSNDPPHHYNHDLIKTEPRSLSFEFGRPHTSSGVSSSYDDPSSHQNHPETYHSPINPNSQALKCIGESERQYLDCSAISSTAVCSEVVATSFLSEQQTNPSSLVLLRPMASMDINQPVVSPAHNPLFPPQVNDSSNYHPGDGFQGMDTTNIPIFHDIPYDIYANHHSLHTKLETRHYDFQSILNHNSSECQNIGAYEDDSPTSTASSNMSGAAGGN
ncbi:hypothetical protein PSTG_15847 [Puccinia striiformis f. sp. tritici PST-78]|uniref:Zn(2)-C6 fungal-type domain-containing protein n=1 Tax=Puccinia striiformis f. sp. tritici PST-78 TaxID=1165861 RepID=A0A0L0UUW9_9BASI|nr:hypothetical protein PSTG_15847 [Puccinia striiformis f. sp. tritici PST-78]